MYVILTIIQEHAPTRIRKAQPMLTVMIALMSIMIFRYATILRPLQTSSMPLSCAVLVEAERIHVSTRITAPATITVLTVKICTMEVQNHVGTLIQLRSRQISCVVVVAVEVPTDLVIKILYEYYDVCVT